MKDQLEILQRIASRALTDEIYAVLDLSAEIRTVAARNLASTGASRKDTDSRYSCTAAGSTATSVPRFKSSST